MQKVCKALGSVSSRGRRAPLFANDSAQFLDIQVAAADDDGGLTGGGQLGPAAQGRNPHRTGTFCNQVMRRDQPAIEVRISCSSTSKISSATCGTMSSVKAPGSTCPASPSAIEGNCGRCSPLT